MKLELGFFMCMKYETGHDKNFMLLLNFLRESFILFTQQKTRKKYKAWLYVLLYFLHVLHSKSHTKILFLFQYKNIVVPTSQSPFSKNVFIWKSWFSEEGEALNFKFPRGRRTIFAEKSIKHHNYQLGPIFCLLSGTIQNFLTNYLRRHRLCFLAGDKRIKFELGFFSESCDLLDSE
jgi:hypothetical protein